MTSTRKSVRPLIRWSSLSGPVSVGHPGQLMMPTRSSGSFAGYSAKVPRLFRKSARQLADEHPRSWVAFEQVSIPMRGIIYLRDLVQSGLRQGLSSAAASVAAIAGRRAARDHAVDDGGGAAHAGVHGDCPEVAVQGAGPALHAQVMVRYRGPLVAHDEDAPRANLDAPAAPGAFPGIVFQRRHVRKIFHTTPHS